MRQIGCAELKAWLDDPLGKPPLLLDVREAWEFQLCHIEGSQLLPMAQIPSRLSDLDRNREMVVICHHGVRSFSVCRFLDAQGFQAVINLSGGVAAWAREVDPRMPTY
jgi:rhodanese-related sulfurtransferase